MPRARHVRRTKIVATLGPASESPEAIGELLDAGVDAFRLNYSHGVHAAHADKVRRVRALAERAGRHVGLLQDLQGPKIRVGVFRDPGGVTLRPGERFRLTADDAPGNAERVGLTAPELIGAVAAGQRLLLRDGRIELRVLGVDAGEILTEVVVGGLLTDHAGINAPAASLALPALTEKDLQDLEHGARLDVDWVALSFVRAPEDLAIAREHLARTGSRARLMAKIEKPAAVFHFDEILAAADGIMVARGDLGVEMRPEDVPMIQKRIIRTCVAAGKPVVTATQMLESMVDAPTPTRAEASDVANAILDGTDAVMLSNETAVGRYAPEAVRIIGRIAQETEAGAEEEDALRRLFDRREPEDTPDAVAHAACRVAEAVGARIVACFTATGSTAWRVARRRPRVTVVPLTPDARAARQLSLGWGIRPILTPDPTSVDHLAAEAVARLRAAGMVSAGDKVVITAGVPLGRPGTTNLLRVEEVKG